MDRCVDAQHFAWRVISDAGKSQLLSFAKKRSIAGISTGAVDRVSALISAAQPS